MTTDSTDRDAALLAAMLAKMAERIERQRKHAAWSAEIFNLVCPPGTLVTLTDDLGTEHSTKTRSVASVSEAGIPTVMVEGRAGGYLLWRIRPRLDDAEDLAGLIDRRLTGRELSLKPEDGCSESYMARCGSTRRYQPTPSAALRFLLRSLPDR